MRPVKPGARLALLFVVTAVAVALGAASDFVWDGTALSVGDVVVGIVLAPIVVTVGGGVVGGPFRSFFEVGGCLFWPLFALLSWRWLATGRRSFLVAVALWSLQGFLLIQHRLGLVMSA
jgi:hypothetical protein